MANHEIPAEEQLTSSKDMAQGSQHLSQKSNNFRKGIDILVNHFHNQNGKIQFKWLNLNNDPFRVK